AGSRPHRQWYLPSVRRCLRHRWHADRGRGAPTPAGAGAPEGSNYSPVRAGSTARNLRHCQGRPAAERRGSGGHQYQVWLDAEPGRAPRRGLRLHAGQPALR
nr:hypothetical protein [Tanacetum cinerariifolium]